MLSKVVESVSTVKKDTEDLKKMKITFLEIRNTLPE